MFQENIKKLHIKTPERSEENKTILIFFFLLTSKKKLYTIFYNFHAFFTNDLKRKMNANSNETKKKIAFTTTLTHFKENIRRFSDVFISINDLLNGMKIKGNFVQVFV